MKRFLSIQGILFVCVIAIYHHIDHDVYVGSTQDNHVASYSYVSADNILTHIDGYEAFYIDKSLLATRKGLFKMTKLDPFNVMNPSALETFDAHVSAYTAAADETGGSGDGITASGAYVRASHTLACPREYAFGTKVHFEGYGTFVCEDRGGAIKGNRFDMYMITKAEAFAFGRRTLVAKVIE